MKQEHWRKSALSTFAIALLRCGLAALQFLQAKGVDLPFIVVSGQIGEDIAVATFGEMRDRLTARTAEREQLLGEVQRRAAELDLSNRELEAFTYSVAHDLRSQ